MTTTPTKNESLPESFPLFVVYTNTDLTEGRGWQYPIAWTESVSSATRMAHKKGVMGSDADIRQEVGFKVGNVKYGPVRIEPTSEEDKAKDAAAKLRHDAIVKATAAGLTEEEIKAIMGVKR